MQFLAPGPRFIGTVKAEWLHDGREMRLLEPFGFVDEHGLVWEAPAGSVVDGASIPRFFWRAIGGPFEGKYREASVLHDVACVRRDRPHAVVHRAFYRMMRARGVAPVQAWLMWAGVCLGGPRWDDRGRELRPLIVSLLGWTAAAGLLLFLLACVLGAP